MAAAGASEATTDVISAGDIVGKGPRAAESVALLRACGAKAVLGNHEVKLQRAFGARSAGAAPADISGASVDSLRERPEDGRPKAAKLRGRLAGELDDWVTSLPLHLSVRWPAAEDKDGATAGGGGGPGFAVSVVHAGVPPTVACAADAVGMAGVGELALCWMRGGHGGRSPADAFETELTSWLVGRGWQHWGRLWGGGGREPVIFGHAAGMRLQLCPRACGLDTGCCKGGLLSALVLEPVPEARLGAARARLEAEAGAAGEAGMDDEAGAGWLPCTLVAVQSRPADGKPAKASDVPATPLLGTPDMHEVGTLDELQGALVAGLLWGGAAAEAEAGRGGPAVSRAWRLLGVERGLVGGGTTLAAVRAGGASVPEARRVWPEPEATAPGVRREGVRFLRASLEWCVWARPAE